MFTSISATQAAMKASTPRTSFCFTTSEWYWPVSSTSTPLMAVICAAPPPMDSPRISVTAPEASFTRMSTVLGWGVWVLSSGWKEKASPASFASWNESRTRKSSGASPKSPATRARSVPWPW